MTSSNSLDAEFRLIREDLGIPAGFTPEVQAEALAAQAKPRPASASLVDVPFITIDPPPSRDLDQAFYARRVGDGFEVRYAIDDVGSFVQPGGAIEAEAWRRGVTLYSPDRQTPLYPPAISEGAASLLPDAERPAIVFTFRLKADASVQSWSLAPALIRSRAKLSYPEVSEHLAHERGRAGSGQLSGHEWSESLLCLEVIGGFRQRLEAERGGVSLRIPTQQVERWTTALTGYRLAFEQASEVEEWNAQISLMTGMAAARMMIERGVGLLRALDPPRPERVRALRLTAAALGVAWPAEVAYDNFVRGLEPGNPLHAVLLHRAARVTGGARYVAFVGTPPAHSAHSAIAAPYAHVTAPLRRLADRYVLDLLVRLAGGAEVPAALVETLRHLPPVMESADRLSRQLDGRIVDFAEARLLAGRIGEVFAAMVIELRPDGANVQITDPPIRTFISAAALSESAAALSEGTASGPANLAADGATLAVGGQRITLGQWLNLRLVAADPQARTLAFARMP